jgi:hypothetical protein
MQGVATELEGRCPICNGAVNLPPLDVLILKLINDYGLSEEAEAVLRCLWDAKGLPVDAEAMFDVMYADDPDGGPSVVASYAALRAALQELERVARGAIVYLGRARGWRMKLPVLADAA